MPLDRAVETVLGLIWCHGHKAESGLVAGRQIERLQRVTTKSTFPFSKGHYPKHTQQLWFLCSAHNLILLIIFEKFQENMFKKIK